MSDSGDDDLTRDAAAKAFGRAGGRYLPAEFDPPLEVIEPEVLASALVISSPHSGAVYPPSFLAHSRLDPLTLRRSEDAYVDELFRGAVAAAGAPLLRAHFPRAYLDVNREPYELDPRMFDGRLPPQANTRSIRVAGGLGTIARVVSESHEIYKGRLPVDEVRNRIEGLYEPYHRALRALLERAWLSTGIAVLLDCHSMPAQQTGAIRAGETTRADVILGDRYGTSCDPNLVAVLERALTRRGLVVGRNKPYAGGFITENYGSPALGTHAVQIEINRSLYMNEATLVKAPGFGDLAGKLTAAVHELSDYISATSATASAAAE